MNDQMMKALVKALGIDPKVFETLPQFVSNLNERLTNLEADIKRCREILESEVVPENG